MAMFYVYHAHRGVYQCVFAGVPERMTAAYSCPKPWPAYLQRAHWSARPCSLRDGCPCAGAVAYCSSRGVCLLPHVVHLRVDPQTRIVHARIARFHPTPHMSLPWGTVDPWRFAAMRALAHNPNTRHCVESVYMQWPTVQQRRLPRHGDPLRFAATKAFAVLDVLYNDWWMGMKQMGQVPQSALLHSACMRSAKHAIALIMRCMRRAHWRERGLAALWGGKVASIVVQALCVLPDAPCRPWMMRLVKLLGASCAAASRLRHAQRSRASRVDTRGASCVGIGVGVLAGRRVAVAAVRVSCGV